MRKTIGALGEFARFLQRLTYPHLAEHFQQRPFRCRDPGCAIALFERSGMKRVGGWFIEQALAVVLRREALGEPVREAGGGPAVQVQNGLLR